MNYSSGAALFTKTYTHIGLYQVCGFEFFKDYVFAFLKRIKFIILKK